MTTSLPPRRGNWRRVFCWWWGHVYVNTIGLLNAQLTIVCLRCYAEAESDGIRVNLTVTTTEDAELR